MSTWILILTLMANGSDGSAITHVEFHSFEACTAAGRAWEKNVKKGGAEWRRPLWNCVENPESYEVEGP